MARKRKLTPTYHPHPTNGRGRAVWTDATGIRHFKSLPGAYQSEESRAAYARLALELAMSPLAMPAGTDDLTMNELMVAYTTHAENHYRRHDGTHTSEYHETKLVARTIR